jgi:DNA-binding NtrC family response regulator
MSSNFPRGETETSTQPTTEADQPVEESRGLIVAVIHDVMFGVAVTNAIQELGFTPKLLKLPSQLPAVLETEKPKLIVVDSTTVGITASRWAPIRDAVAANYRVIAYAPHRNILLMRAALDAGVARLVRKGQFHRDMGLLIERYATLTDLDEEWL